MIPFLILMLTAQAYAATLTCQYDLATSTCSSWDITPITQKNEPISVVGVPSSPFTDSKTSTFYISMENGAKMQEFPTNLFGIFTNATNFYSYNMSMTELLTDSFYNCKSLETMYFEFVNFGNIRERFASTCSSVKDIEIYNSKIYSIDENSFVGLESLLRLIIFQSFLTCIPPMIFQPIKQIQMINLDSNNLTAIHSHTFSGLKFLDTVNLNYNPISYLPNFNLSTTGTSSVTSQLWISMWGNPILAVSPHLITSIYKERRFTENDALVIDFQIVNHQATPTCVTSPTSFNGNPYAIVNNNFDKSYGQNISFNLHSTCYSAFTSSMASDSLVTCGNFITTSTSTSTTTSSTSSTIPPTTVGNQFGGQCATDKICRFYLDWNNQYTCVIDGAEGTVTSITGTHYLTYTNADVKRVYFINSYLSLVPKILFQTFPGLNFLHTANSGMIVINDQTFNECAQLELWDASDNEISHVDETSLRNCTSLRIIDLTGNPIDYVSQGLYQLDPDLERVHLLRLDDWTLD